MIYPIIFLTVACILEAETDPIEAIKEENSTRKFPLTGHLLKCLNHFDDSIIGFHLVVPRDDLVINNCVEKPSHVSKILKYVTRINYLRNMIENDPEVSLKKKSDRNLYFKNVTTSPIREKRDYTHHTHTLIPLPMSQHPDIRNSSKKVCSEESLIFVPYQKNEIQNSTDIRSKPVGLKNSDCLDLKQFWHDKTMDNFLKKIEDGLRVYPLIPVCKRNDCIDFITSKVNCSQPHICFLRRTSRSEPARHKSSEKCAFLVQSWHSANPSLLFVPKSMDQTPLFNAEEVESKLRSKMKEPSCNSVFHVLSSNEPLPRSMTFLVPLLESTLVLPIKTNEFSDLLFFTKNDFVKKEDTLSSNIKENCSVNYSKFDKTDKINMYNKSYNNVSSADMDINNATLNNYYNSISFADVLRLSITDLVNGLDSNSQPYRSLYDKDETTLSPNTSSDYNLYFLFDPDKEVSPDRSATMFINISDSNVHYSSPKSKVNKTPLMDSCEFINMSDFRPFIMSLRINQRDYEKEQNMFPSLTFDRDDGINGLNNFYRDRVLLILSHAKKGQCRSNSPKRKRSWYRNFKQGKLATNDSEIKFLIKYVPKNFDMSQDEIGQRSNWTFNRFKRTDEYGMHFKISKSRIYFSLDPSNDLPVGVSTFDSSLLKNKPQQYKDILVSRIKKPSRKNKAIGGINRCLGEIMLIPQMNRHFCLLTAYPYQIGNRKIKTIVRKSINKSTGHLSEKIKEPILSLPSSFSSSDNILQAMPIVSKNLHVKDELNKENQKGSKIKGKIESTSKPDPKHIRRPVNLTESFHAGIKSPVNVPDLQSVKSLQSVNIPAQLHLLKPDDPELYEGHKGLYLLQNLTAFNILNASKNSHIESLAQMGPSKSAPATENTHTRASINTETLNSTSLKPIHSSNDCRVSNGTNLHIKLTELKTPKDHLKSEEKEPLVRATTDSSVTNTLFMQILSKPPLYHINRLNSTDIPFASNETKMLTNSYQGIGFIGTLNPFELPHTCNKTDMSQENLGYYEQNVQNTSCMYCFTESYERDNVTCFAQSNSPFSVGKELPYFRSTITSACVTPVHEEDGAQESEDSVDRSIYPNFAPIIVVHIFPIVAGWGKTLLEALSLIKELFGMNQKKVEVEELHTYLSELFDVVDNNKNQSEY